VIPALSETQARALTERIKGAAEDLWKLLYEAHEGKAWRVLGYDSWKSYVTTEFGMSEQHSYRLLDHATIMHALEAGIGSPVGESVREGTTRAIPKARVKELVAEVKTQVDEGVAPAEAVKQVTKTFDVTTRTTPASLTLPADVSETFRENAAFLNIPASVFATRLLVVYRMLITAARRGHRVEAVAVLRDAGLEEPNGR